MEVQRLSLYIWGLEQFEMPQISCISYSENESMSCLLKTCWEKFCNITDHEHHCINYLLLDNEVDCTG